MPSRFHNVVLTGACGGLGQALATALLDAGARVALVGMDRTRLDALAARAPERSAVYTLDVADPAAMQAMAQDWMARHGLPDLVIANAGVAGGYDTAQASDLAVMRRMLEINLLGVATTFQPFLAAAGARPAQPLALVGVASLAGWRGLPGNGAYCASKAGLICYLQSLRAELRGFKLPIDVGRFLLNRLSRDMRTLLTTLNQLDNASFRAKRKLTIPFVKEILEL